MIGRGYGLDKGMKGAKKKTEAQELKK